MPSIATMERKPLDVSSTTQEPDPVVGYFTRAYDIVIRPFLWVNTHRWASGFTAAVLTALVLSQGMLLGIVGRTVDDARTALGVAGIAHEEVVDLRAQTDRLERQIEETRRAAETLRVQVEEQSKSRVKALAASIGVHAVVLGSWVKAHTWYKIFHR